MNGEVHPFDEAVKQPESDVRLAHAALLWARDEYEDIAPKQYLDRLSALADRVDGLHASTGTERVEALRDTLVVSASYRGNYEDFANPANSYLNRVIDMRRGNPVSLGAIWLDIAKQLDWPMFGLAMPGHFLIRYEGVADEVIVDPFNSGRILSEEDCTKMYSAMFGDEAVREEFHSERLETFGILARMLGNLYVLYANAGDWSRTALILRRLVAVQPRDAVVRAEFGRVLTLLGDFKEAAATLNEAMTLADGDEEKATINHHLIGLRSKFNEQN